MSSGALHTAGPAVLEARYWRIQPHFSPLLFNYHWLGEHSHQRTPLEPKREWRGWVDTQDGPANVRAEAMDKGRVELHCSISVSLSESYPINNCNTEQALHIFSFLFSLCVTCHDCVLTHVLTLLHTIISQFAKLCTVIKLNYIRI